MRTHLIIAAAILQVLVLGYMAGEREWVVRTGRVIYLRTAPVDPRDAMRGDYVRLDYEISRVPEELLRDGLARNTNVRMPRRDMRVYASLRVRDDGLAELVSLSDLRPKEGLFIRGRLDPAWSISDLGVVRYGIEAFFMEQGKALELEQSRVRDQAQVPLEMETAVSPNGLAVLKGVRWSPLGIGLDLDPPQDGQGGVRRVRGAAIRLLNSSDKDIAIVDLPGARSLALVPERRFGDNPWRWVHEGEEPPTPEPGHVIVLKPGQSHQMRVDLRDPYWFVRGGAGPGGLSSNAPIPELRDEWGLLFRFVYRPPEPKTCAELPNAKLIWHGRLPSRAFRPVGRID